MGVNGAGGYSTSTMDNAQWSRVVISVDNGNFFKVYINGNLFHTYNTQPVDDPNVALDPTIYFFVDDNSTANLPLNVSTIAMWGRALDGSEVRALGGASYPTTLSPVTLDLSGNGLGYVALSGSDARFDFTNDNLPDRTAWVAPDDGLLAYDANHDGRITQRSEFVFTDLAPNAQTDMEALRWAFDSNGDAWLSPADKDWASFGVWQDANGNGINDAGEFRSLESWGIVKISLQSDGVSSTPVDGVVLHGVSPIVWADGHTSSAGDVSFGFEPTPALNDAAIRPLQDVADTVNHSLDTTLTDTVAQPLPPAIPPAATDPVLANVYARFQQAVAALQDTARTEPQPQTVLQPDTGLHPELADSIERLKEAAARASTTTHPTPSPAASTPPEAPRTPAPDNAAPTSSPAQTLLSGNAYKNLLLGHDANTGPITSEAPASPHIVPTVPDTTAAINWQPPTADLSHPAFGGLELHHPL